MSDNCDYRKFTTRFKNTLQLPEEMFDPKFDYCFCPECHEDRGDREHYKYGNPAEMYVMPLDCRRFGIRMRPPTGLKYKDVFNNWHVAYHGTEFKSIESIWRVGLRIPGETTADGKKIVELCGHFNDERKPKGFDTKKIFVSPSPRYSGGDEYAHTKIYADPATGKEYVCKCMFQLLIKPGTYVIGPKTVKGSNIDPYIDDKVLEWSTKNKDAIMLTGLLIKMTPKKLLESNNLYDSMIAQPGII